MIHFVQIRTTSGAIYEQSRSPLANRLGLGLYKLGFELVELFNEQSFNTKKLDLFIKRAEFV